jgi:catechol 2,3-dioxygenase-like lactoylglutathione lyase family enzyme
MKTLDILGLDHVVLRVSDVAASLRFYCDVLGCVEERRLDAIGLIQLRAGSSLIDLVPVDSPLGRNGGAAPGSEGRNVDHFALALSHFDEAGLRRHLLESGVEPGEVGVRYGALGNGPSMYIRDPDDNIVELKGPPGEP